MAIKFQFKNLGY